MVMVFLALLEYGLILWIKFKHFNGFVIHGQVQTTPDLTSTKSQDTCLNNWKENDMKNIQMSSIHTLQNTPQRSTFNVRIIDKFSIIVFPLSFVVFNIVYWGIYVVHNIQFSKF